MMMLPPLVPLYTSGENMRYIDTIIDSESMYLIGYAYNEENYNYLKWRRIHFGPKVDVIALGSSRVLQFRNTMFQTSFYNAGYSISSIKDFLPFLEGIPKEKYPQYLIMGLDQWMFNEHWDDLSKVRTPAYWSKSFHYKADAPALIYAWRDLLRGKIKFFYRKNGTMDFVGLNAVINNKGFRNDGSMCYGSQIEKLLKNDPTANDYQYSDTYKRIESGNKRFEHGDTANTNAIMELDRILSFCKQNEICVVGILPPFARQINIKMGETGAYGYMEEIYPESKKVFDRYAFELYDFTNPDRLGADDSEALDGFHLGEGAYVKLLLKILESNSVLNAVTDVDKLKSDFQHKLNRYMVYQYGATKAVDKMAEPE